MEYLVGPSDGLILSILVLFLGRWLTEKISFLQNYNIPTAVTGGLLCSLTVAAIYASGGPQIIFDMTIRDMLLLSFFSTIGLSAKLNVLKEGGKPLGLMVIIAGIFLCAQDIIGIFTVKMMGYPAGYGLFGGSISYAGGYGTAIAWGEIAVEAGLTYANEVGIACATFGLIGGSLIGGPIAKRLISKNQLVQPSQENPTENLKSEEVIKETSSFFHVNDLLGTLLAIAVCFEAGDMVNRLLFSKGVMVPGFLTAMLCGIILTNVADVFRLELNEKAIEMTSEISLQVFLSLSLMSIQLWTLAGAMTPLLIILIAQVTLMTIYTSFVVFRMMGKDYDACVISAGFAGLGLGATPVAIANMNAITEKYGPSPKAFLVIPIVGAFFIDVMNAAVIKFFLPVVERLG